MRRDIPDDLAQAQRAYMVLTGVQISQTEVQRLSAALHGGQSIPDAVAAVYSFFTTPIDWNAERAAFAAVRRGTIRGRITIAPLTD